MALVSQTLSNSLTSTWTESPLTQRRQSPETQVKTQLTRLSPSSKLASFTPNTPARSTSLLDRQGRDLQRWTHSLPWRPRPQRRLGNLPKALTPSDHPWPTSSRQDRHPLQPEVRASLQQGNHLAWQARPRKGSSSVKSQKDVPENGSY